MTRSLHRLLATPSSPPEQRCELCAAPTGGEHPHLVEVEERRLLCACIACAMLFSEPKSKLRYRRVPDRYLTDPDFELSDEHWEALQIPVGMAFFLRNSSRETVVACYPSPAGATESELNLESWSEGVGTSALAAELAPDVEALLVRRETSGQSECLLVPIDACYQLVGLVRMYWKGFDGGTEAWTAIDAFFDDLRNRARTMDRR